MLLVREHCWFRYLKYFRIRILFNAHTTTDILAEEKRDVILNSAGSIRDCLTKAMRFQELKNLDNFLAPSNRQLMVYAARHL